MKLSDSNFNFRGIVNKLVIFQNKEIVEKLHKKKLNELSDSVLTFCYIDNECGITFEYLCPFNIEKRALFVQEDKDYSYKFRFGSVVEEEFLIIDSDRTGDKIIDEYIESIQKNYDSDENIKQLRQYSDFDHIRAKEFPDDVMIGVFKEGLGGEGMYVKLLKMKNDKIYGKLLNEPYQNFGIHLNDIIEVKLGKNKDGKLECFYECN
jgi:hypothetical protein